MITKGAVAKELAIHDGVITKTYGPYDRDLSKKLVDITLRYRQQMSDCGVSYPKNLRTVEVPNGIGNYIVIDDEYLPVDDCKQALSNGLGEREKREIVTRMIDFLNRLPDGPYRNSTALMGDFKPANWVRLNGDLYFIDHFLPRIWGDGVIEPYVEAEDAPYFTRKNLTYLWGDRRGQMGRFLGLMKRQHPDYYPIAVDYAKESSRENISRFIEQEEPLGFPTIAKAYQR